MALTARQIDTAKPADKDYKLADAQGLYLLVKTSGAKYWNLKFRFGGKEKKLSIGVYPSVTLAQARSERDRARRMIAEGTDPSHAKQAKKRALRESTASTFKAIATEWFAHKARTWTARYLADQQARMENKVYPAIGHRPVSEIKPLEVLHCLREVESEGKLETLRKTRQICVQIFAWAIVTGRATSNPADYLNTALLSPARQNNRSLTAEQLPGFVRDVMQSVYFMAKGTRLLMLTGLRTGEMRLGRWDEVDFDKALWEIPKERMKKRRPHVVPLSRQALALLVELKALADATRSPFILPSALRADKPRGRRCINDFLIQTGWHEYTTAHGFRHTFSTLAHDNGFNTAWIELQLAHVDKNSIRGTYNHAQYLDDRRAMMQWYADMLDSPAPQS
ncbi:tyrosine-type recombinase/integrase [Lelliottia wanjuensis]|uniref:tyrosine-type recombinase/integrase n=1 Tax=Lelliottia wanjuensis TaxID=3050585 RepID=UPI00254E9730|nr:integrase arm-type DNA-binding domain-containing protein [Lelliottia sp. V104_15]MDK9606317.1 integrase arm-type DNA-binding domain-containing protein [Lelliottia sp. V104_15]